MQKIEQVAHTLPIEGAKRLTFREVSDTEQLHKYNTVSSDLKEVYCFDMHTFMTPHSPIPHDIDLH